MLGWWHGFVPCLEQVEPWFSWNGWFHIMLIYCTSVISFPFLEKVSSFNLKLQFHFGCCSFLLEHTFLLYFRVPILSLVLQMSRGFLQLWMTWDCPGLNCQIWSRYLKVLCVEIAAYTISMFSEACLLVGLLNCRTIVNQFELRYAWLVG